MVRYPRRRTIGEKLHSVIQKDTQEMFSKEFIDNFIGFGIFAAVDIPKGEPILKYRGDHISRKVADERAKQYDEEKLVGSYIYELCHSGATVCVDATYVDGLAKYVNDSPKSDSNCGMKKLVMSNEVHLVLYTLRDIPKGEELRYNYGYEADWRNNLKYQKPFNIKDLKKFHSSKDDSAVVDEINKLRTLDSNVMESTVEEAEEINKLKILDSNVIESTVEEAGEINKLKTLDSNVMESTVEESEEINKLKTLDSNVMESTVEEAEEINKLKTLDSNVIESTVEEAGEINKLKTLDSNVMESTVEEAGEFKKVQISEGKVVESVVEKPKEISDMKDLKIKDVNPKIEEPKIHFQLDYAFDRAKNCVVLCDDVPDQIPPLEVSITNDSGLKGDFPEFSDTDTDEGENECTASNIVAKIIAERTENISGSESEIEDDDLFSPKHYINNQVNDVPMSPKEANIANLKSRSGRKLKERINYEESDATDDDLDDDYNPNDDLKDLEENEDKIIDEESETELLPRKKPKLEKGIKNEKAGAESCSDLPSRKRPKLEVNPSSIKTIKDFKENFKGNSVFQKKAASTNIKKDNVENATEHLSVTNSSSKKRRYPFVTVRVSGNTKSKRDWGKKHYCFFCDKGFPKVGRHCEDVHYNEKEVIPIVNLQIRKTDSKAIKDKKKALRAPLLEDLRILGDFHHNMKVLSEGKGELVVAKCPSGVKYADEFLPCDDCLMFYFKNDLHRHKANCKKKSEKKSLSNRVQGIASMMLPINLDVSEDLKKVLSSMIVDEVSNVVKADETILQFGNKLCHKHFNNSNQCKYISNKLRELGRFLINLKDKGISSLLEAINPCHFPTIISIAAEMAGINKTQKLVATPSLGIKLGQLLEKIAAMVETDALVKGNTVVQKRAKNLRKLIANDWNDSISRVSRNELRSRKRNSVPLIPVTEDLQAIKSFINKIQTEALTKGQRNEEMELSEYRALANATLVSLIMFIRRREGEASMLLMSDLQKKRNDHLNKEIRDSLSPFELQLSKYLKRIEIRGKRDRTVPLLITKQNEKSISLLVSHRNRFVKEDNEFVFAVPHKESVNCIRGNDSIRYIVNKCDLKHPEAIGSTKLRKHIATISQLIDLEESELEMLANFLGHDIAVHREFYRLPDQTVQLAKCGKLLMMLDKGLTSDFIGKKLKDIELDMEEEIEETDDENDVEGENIEAGNLSKKSYSSKTDLPEEPGTNSNEIQNASNNSQTSCTEEPEENKKRKYWSKEEKDFVFKEMAMFLKRYVTPKKEDCIDCLKKGGLLLKNRTWVDVK